MGEKYAHTNFYPPNIEAPKACKSEPKEMENEFKQVFEY